MRRYIILLLSVTVCLNVKASTNVTALNDGGIERWESKVFAGESIYTLGDYKGRLALKALSHNTASGLLLKNKIDLAATPYINWNWLVEKKLTALDEHSKSGDDFVARIYVVFNVGLMVWKTRSLNYVWSSNQEQGLVWNNPFAGAQTKMMSVRGLAAKKGVWYEEKRNVYQDLIATFGDKGSEAANRKAYRYIDVIAIMTDTDNSGKEAETYYGDITFTAL